MKNCCAIEVAFSPLFRSVKMLKEEERDWGAKTG